MATLDYDSIIYMNGEKVRTPDKFGTTANHLEYGEYYYNKKLKKYVRASINETTEEMFEMFKKQNGNTSCPPRFATAVLPLDNKCLLFYKNSPEPVIFINGGESKLYPTPYGYKDHSGDVQIYDFFKDEFDGQIIGYEVHYKNNIYLVIYGYVLNERDRKSLIKMLDKRLRFDAEKHVYYIECTDCDYYLLLDYTIRKDYKRNALRDLWKTIKNKEKEKGDVKKAFNDWLFLH